jgi:hypothetical protein
MRQPSVKDKEKVPINVRHRVEVEVRSRSLSSLGMTARRANGTVEAFFHL